MALLDAGAIEPVFEGLISGQLTISSTGARRDTIACGSSVVEYEIRRLQLVWRDELLNTSSDAIAFALMSAAEGIKGERTRSSLTEVVWTGPRVDGSYLRATRQVVLEIIKKSNKELLVVEYWIAADIDSEGVIPQVIDAMADAARRGVVVRVVLDRAIKPGGESNHKLFKALWPKDVPLPLLYTWNPEASGKYLKLHAKIIVADRYDALVTSANLTMHALDLNMEMGVRVMGSTASSIAEHFVLLIDHGVLDEYILEV